MGLAVALVLAALRHVLMDCQCGFCGVNGGLLASTTKKIVIRNPTNDYIRRFLPGEEAGGDEVVNSLRRKQFPPLYSFSRKIKFTGR